MRMVDILNEAFAGPAWHGPALRSAVRGMTAAQAAWRPARDRHNAWEVVVHAAYWKHIVRQRLTGERDRFPLAGRNWFVRPGAERAWADDLDLLEAEHDRLLEAVKGLRPRALARMVHAGQTAEQNIRGIAAHDVYHAGQIRLLKALVR